MGTEDGYASAAEATVASVRESVATAVVSLQGQLRKDLQEDELQIFSVLGRGGYGIVYHGGPPPPSPLSPLPSLGYAEARERCVCVAPLRWRCPGSALSSTPRAVLCW